MKNKKSWIKKFFIVLSSMPHNMRVAIDYGHGEIVFWAIKDGEEFVTLRESIKNLDGLEKYRISASDGEKEFIHFDKMTTYCEHGKLKYKCSVCSIFYGKTKYE